MTDCIYQGLKGNFNPILDSSSTDNLSIENYEIQISRSIFHAYPSYLCKVSFFTTLNIYKDYFKGRLRWCNLMQSDYSLKLWPETICPSSSFSWTSCYFLYAKSFVTKELLNFHRVDELKNFVTNIFLKLVCQSRTRIRSSIG